MLAAWLDDELPGVSMLGFRKESDLRLAPETGFEPVTR